jgi:hypothetical protein
MEKWNGGILSPLRKLIFCHQATKTLKLTNFNILIYNILCYLPAAGRVGALEIFVAILLFRLFGAGSIFKY